MFYRLHSSAGNTVGIDDYLGYLEIGDNGYCRRYVEIRADGTALRYSADHEADGLGQLPEGPWDDDEAGQREYGAVLPISRELFEAVWRLTRCVNESADP